MSIISPSLQASPIALALVSHSALKTSSSFSLALLLCPTLEGKNRVFLFTYATNSSLISPYLKCCSPPSCATTLLKLWNCRLDFVRAPDYIPLRDKALFLLGPSLVSMGGSGYGRCFFPGTQGCLKIRDSVWKAPSTTGASTVSAPFYQTAQRGLLRCRPRRPVGRWLLCYWLWCSFAHLLLKARTFYLYFLLNHLNRCPLCFPMFI